MQYALESFTGVRPTADLTVANYIGAVKPILDQEAAGETSGIFIAEHHATTTDRPVDVAQHALELGRTLIASGVKAEIYSQRQVRDLVLEAELCFRGLTTIARVLRLPTLKEKVTQSDDVATATVALTMYPMLMAADIALARPKVVPTGKDQKPHLEITSELIRAFNREYDTCLPIPQTRHTELPNIMSLDGSGRKMSKSLPKGAIFLSDKPDVGYTKIRRAQTASEPGAALDASINNMLLIARSLSDDPVIHDTLMSLALGIKNGRREIKTFKNIVGGVVSDFLIETNARRDDVSDAEVTRRVTAGSDWFRPIGEETLDYMRAAYWS